MMEEKKKRSCKESDGNKIKPYVKEASTEEGDVLQKAAVRKRKKRNGAKSFNQGNRFHVTRTN